MNLFTRLLLLWALTGSAHTEKNILSDPWKVSYTGWYEMSFYHIKRTFWQANKFCEDAGAHLVKVDDESITAVINATITLSYKIGYYIGASDYFQEGLWEWSDGTAIGYKNWREGEPNDLLAEDCASVGYKSYQWLDVDCDYGFYFICQKRRPLPVRLKVGLHELTFHRYLSNLSDLKYKQENADLACQRADTRLVEVVSKEINDAISREAYISGGQYWTGGRYDATDLKWKWNGGTEFTYSQWRNGGTHLHQGDCLAVGKTGWMNSPCDSELSFICEKVDVHDMIISPEGLEVGAAGNYVINCSVAGLPLPDVRWYKTPSVELVSSSQDSAVFQTRSGGSSTLDFRRATISDDGEYFCFTWKQTTNGNNIRGDIKVKVDGRPTIESIKSYSCNSSLSVLWKPSPRAVGFQHRISISDSFWGSVRLKQALNPTRYAGYRVYSGNLSSSTMYTVKITACKDLECSSGYEASQEAATGGIPKQVNTLKMENRASEMLCEVVWSKQEVIPEDLIMGYEIVVESSLVATRYNNSSSKTVETFTSSKEDLSFEISTLPNRNYTAKVRAETCFGLGEPTNAEGICVTDIAAPTEILNLEISDAYKDDGTRVISLKIPDERNGLMSCVFIIVAIATTDNTNVKAFGLEDLDKANASSGEGNAAYIAVALQVAGLSTTGSRLDIILGNGSKTSCNLYDVGLAVNRRKRELTDEVDKIYEGRNPKLDREKPYSIFVVSTTPSGDQIIFQKSPRSLFGRSSATGFKVPMIIIVVGLVILLLMLAIVMIVVVTKRKRNITNKDSVQMTEFEKPNDLPERSGETVYDNFSGELAENENSATDLAITDLEEVYDSMKMNNNALFLEQFQNILEEASAAPQSTQFASDPSLKKKNRYKNILPYDHSRVIIQASETGYINACYIDGERQPREFIATQGPLRATVEDFWLMAVEQQCGVIVMLTKGIEAGKKKCEKYWPDSGKVVQCGSIRLENKSEVNFSAFIRRTILVRVDNQAQEKPLTISHYQFLKWPDHGVPQTTSNLLRMHREVMQNQGARQSTSPIIVHCSAGAGRTGTFIAYDILNEEMKRRNKVDVYACVTKMRKQRVEMVQNCDQYILVHKLVLESYMFGDTDFNPPEIEDRLEKIKSNDKSEAIEEFKKLSIIGPMKNTQVDALQREHGKMDRNLNIIPYDYARVKIAQRSGERAPPYINASWVESYDESSPMIAAQGPLDSTLSYFWRAILDNNVNTIVMLTQLNDGKLTQCEQYWPGQVGDTRDFGGISVTLTDQRNGGSVIERKMKVTREATSKIVTQLQYLDWKETACPEDGSHVVQLVEDMQKNIRASENAVALIHCSDGAGRTGTFCAIVNLIDRLKLENRVDVFRAVKDLRDGRPGMVQTLSEYIFCHQAIIDYMKSFDLYSNF